MAPTEALFRHKEKNAITRLLSQSDWENWRHQCKLDTFEPSASTSTSRAYSSHVIFPTSAIFSVTGESLSDGLAESSMVGNESMVGIWNLFADDSYSVGFAVQTGGFGIVTTTSFLRAEFIRSSAFRYIVLDHTTNLVRYATQTCICYRHHSPRQQVVKTLLLTAHRLGEKKIAMTHQTIGTLLGLRREAVSLAIRDLARLNLVRQERGATVILDYIGMTKQACECFAYLTKLSGNRI